MGVAAVCAGVMYSTSYETVQIGEDHTELITMIGNQNKYFEETHMSAQQLIDEANQNILASYDSIVELSKAAKSKKLLADLKNPSKRSGGVKAVDNAMVVLKQNVQTADNSIKKGVDPKKIKENFELSKLNYQMASIYPKETGQIHDIK